MIQTTAILAMSADGKLTDRTYAPSTFVSERDQLHLEEQVAQADAVIFGAGTLRAYGTTLRVRNPHLIQQRRNSSLPDQPLQIVCSQSADLDPTYPYFSQPIPRVLLTNPQGAAKWRDRSEFGHILTAESDPFDWHDIFAQLETLNVKKLALLGGGQLVGALFSAGLVNELWLTICPIVLGSTIAPVPVAGDGFTIAQAPRLELLETHVIGSEVFLHYHVYPPSIHIVYSH
jgi:5-amino-6-(5-phosphoribosylamino)uracil reductase